MSNRISIKQLEQLVAVLNTRTDHALQPYTRNEAGEFIGNPGNYHLSGAYGGYALDQMMPTGTGVRRISTIGYATKRELYNWITAYLAGLDTTSANNA